MSKHKFDAEYQKSKKYKYSISRANAGIFEKKLTEEKMKLAKTIYGREIPILSNKTTMMKFFSDNAEKASEYYSQKPKIVHSSVQEKDNN